jgi:antitoxin (DNA-binding transcriptional repressor) of toxin-antitoxin stability system
MIINISEAEANLSKLIDLVCDGEKIVIAKNNLPLVDMVRHKPAKPRKLGLLTGQIEVPENFTDEDSEINEMFYGKNESLNINQLEPC